MLNKKFCKYCGCVIINDKCPCCGALYPTELYLNIDGFKEELFCCSSCDAEWISKHGGTEIIRDSNKNTFLEAETFSTDGTAMNFI